MTTFIPENTFAAACYDMNSIASLEAALSGPADKTDMREWNLTEQEWRDQIELALKAKREGMTKHHVISYGEKSEIIGEAATENEARALFADVWNIDFYDAEDGPRVARYEPNGQGCFIVDGVLA